MYLQVLVPVEGGATNKFSIYQRRIPVPGGAFLATKFSNGTALKDMY